MKMGLLKVFKELRQTVIWKLEAELTDIPKNVHILKWAPQQSILCKWNSLSSIVITTILFYSLNETEKNTSWFIQIFLFTAHRNCKLFVSHGGLLSISESLHYGVPIIGIPLFADHHVNMIRAVKKGFGLQLGLSDDLPEKLNIAINEMLSNNK